MKKILIVDDEEAIIQMYSAVLSENFEVSSAKNGQDAISMAKKEKFDLIYLDIIMPKMNGLDVLRQLKSDPETRDTAVVLLTNLPKEASADKAILLGAKDYFVKVENDPERIALLTKQLLS